MKQFNENKLQTAKPRAYKVTYSTKEVMHETYFNQQEYYIMNIEIEKTPAFALENNVVSQFSDLETLGLYTYIKMLIEHESRSLPDIIELIKEHFSLDEQYILNKIKMISETGVLFVAKKNK